MLNALARARREPEPAVLALIVGVAFGVLLAVAAGDDKPSVAAAPTPTTAGNHAPAASTRRARQLNRLRMRLRAALAEAVREVEADGSAGEAAAWVDGWSSPVEVGDTGRPSRMWSMSKPVTAVATLRAAGDQLSPGVQQAMQDAITRSDNCAQRLVILELQRLYGGIAGARNAFDSIFAQAEVEPPSPAAEAGGISSEPECITYLKAHAADVASPLAPALLLGVPEWTVDSAVNFAYSLADGRYGAAGEKVLALMRLPKQRALEGVPQDMTAPLDWGAGAAFPNAWQPAYKGGWGGSRQGAYVAGQIVVLTVGGTRVALAVMFHPSRQPPSDDPGVTNAPEALFRIFTAARGPLRSLEIR